MAAPTALDLSYYDLPELYEQPFLAREADVAFFTACAAGRAGKVLEYGAGTGRVTLPLARAGAHVVAVDKSPAMLRTLRSRLAQEEPGVQARVEVVRGDMRKLRLPEQFGLVLATFNVVGHLPRLSDMRSFLGAVRAMLAPGGELVFDVPLPHPDEVEADPDEVHRLPAFKDPVSKKWIEATERYEYDHERQTLLVETELRPRGAKDPLVQKLVLRQWFPQEIAALLEYEGFQVELFADYSLLPAALTEETLIVRARRA